MKPYNALMSGLIDYAGLFPPARLDMKTTVRNYAEYVGSANAWMLNRLIVPVSRFDELESALNDLEATDSEKPWQLSAIVGDDLESDFDRIAAFEEQFGEHARVTSLEIRASSSNQIDEAIETIPEDIMAYFELPLDKDIRGMMTAIAGSDHGAKIRTGGVTPDLIPSAEAVADFLISAHQAGVPFKATAGLHLPVRNRNDDVGATMHGFLCVFGAAIMRYVHACERDELVRILNIDQLSIFGFLGDEMRIFDRVARAHEVEEARDWAHSFGSCSFEEPIHSTRAASFFEPSRETAEAE